MKNLILTLLTMMFVSLFSVSSLKNGYNTSDRSKFSAMDNGKIVIKVNSKVFTATLLDNSTAKALKKLLPLTMKMIELNGNEKYFDLPNSLPTNSFNPREIKNGDLMLFGSKTLVLFYKDFSTSYRYTKLGSIDDLTGFVSALGHGNVTVTFELK